MKDSEYKEMMDNLKKKKKGKPSKPSREEMDAAWFSGNDFGYEWLLNTKGWWIYGKEDEWRLATDKEIRILQDAPIIFAMRHANNEKETQRISEYIKGIRK